MRHGFRLFLKEIQRYNNPKMKHELWAGMRNRIVYKLRIFLQVL